MPFPFTDRYINHSCEPNCASRLCYIDGAPKIIIFATRNIDVGEELCYDYMFEPTEVESERIRCLCKAPACKGWMN